MLTAAHIAVLLNWLTELQLLLKNLIWCLFIHIITYVCIYIYTYILNIKHCATSRTDMELMPGGVTGNFVRRYGRNHVLSGRLGL